MVKKCIVEYDELNNPIGLIDLKEFTDSAKLKEFKELCDKNKEQFLQRKAELEEKAQKEKEILENKVKYLEKGLELCLHGIAHLLGLEKFNGIEKAFTFFKGEDEDE